MDRIEIYNKIFDMLEELELVKWTKIYNRNDIINAFSQINISPYIYMNKTQAAYSSGMRRIFNTEKLNKISKESWDVYLLYLFSYKKCNICNKTQNINNFNADINRTHNLQHECVSCSINRKGQNYLSNKDKYIENEKINRKNNKEELSKISKNRRKSTKLSLLGENPKCYICGYNKNLAALDLHHIDKIKERPEWTYTEKGKNKSPSSYLYRVSIELAVKRYNSEKDNLMIICANCHREEHNKELNL